MENSESKFGVLPHRETEPKQVAKIYMKWGRPVQEQYKTTVPVEEAEAWMRDFYEENKGGSFSLFYVVTEEQNPDYDDDPDKPSTAYLPPGKEKILLDIDKPKP